MYFRLKFFAVVPVLMSFIVAFSGSQSLHAQASALPDGWCQQASDVQFRRSARYIETVGASNGGIRAVYQAYNQRIVLQRTEPREVVQVLEEGINISRIRVIRYTDNCRYLIASIREINGSYSTVVYDLLSTSPGRLGSIPNSGHNWETVESSPEGTYLLVTATNGLYLWNFNSNTQTFLTALVRSDCEFVGTVGCSGELSTYRGARWDVPHELLQLDVIDNYTVTLTLPDATIQRVEGTYSAKTATETNADAAAFTSDYACMPRLQYQTYNRRIILTERLSHTLVSVIEDNLDLAGFQSLGWSADCHYIAAEVADKNGIRLEAWNVQDGTRSEYALTAWVNNAWWGATSNMITVRSHSRQIDWDVSSGS